MADPDFHLLISCTDPELNFTTSSRCVPRVGDILSYVLCVHDREKWADEAWENLKRVHCCDWRVEQVYHEFRRYEVMKPESHVIHVRVVPADKRPEPTTDENGDLVAFGIRGGKLFFAVGCQSFTLDYVPEEPGSFEFMTARLTEAFDRMVASKRSEEQPAALPDVRPNPEACRVAEPTDEMLEAGAAAFEATLHSAADFKHHAYHVFMAMLAAQPKEVSNVD